MLRRLRVHPGDWFRAILCSLTLAATSAAADMSQDGVWSDTAIVAKAAPTGKLIKLSRFRLLTLDRARFEAVVTGAPVPWSPFKAPVLFELPLPDGGFERFEIVKTQLIHPDLAARYPQIRTYKGIGFDDRSAWARFEWTDAGFHGYAKTAKGTVYIDPYATGDTGTYMSYFRRDFRRDPAETVPEQPPIELPQRETQARETRDLVARSTGAELRTYRIAIAATGEYAQAVGSGTVSGALGAIVVALDRVTGIYENDVAVSFQLVGNNDQVVYTNGAIDPYTDDNAGALLEENQANLDSVIGDANYDVGHVFSTGGGGVAALGVPCVAGWKARGVTGSANPVGDPYYVDFVAHEVGHQFGAYHTFNGDEGFCAGNRSPASAYEPGSGSTIMGYAGICGSQDVQTSSTTAGGASDDYFHTKSIEEIIAYTTTGDGKTCAAITATGNSPPIANAGTGGFYIPAETPFVLTGGGMDPDGNASLTYTWEQHDLGPEGMPDATKLGPLFRSREGTADPWRYFPQLTDILSGSNGNTWEILPAIDRDLNFRLTVRDKDNSLVGTGGLDSDEISFQVDAAAGPFRVTNPNTFVDLRPGDPMTVTWDVAGTSGGNVNCPAVDILLSTDGGTTFSTILAGGTPNDGSEVVVSPLVNTYYARVSVECADNIFLDISDADFQVTNFPREEVFLNPSSTDVPKTIPDTGAPAVTSTLNIAEEMEIQDVNLIDLTGTHTWISDLEFTLTSPQGTSVVVIGQLCFDEDDFDLNLDDEASLPVSSIPCPPTDGGIYVPTQPLSAFDGENTQGVWALTVQDYYDLDGGSLDSWGLQITGVSVSGGDYDCSGTTPVVFDKTFQSGEDVDCIGTSSVGTSGTVTVASGAAVRFLAPKVHLTPGFSAETGSSFAAGPL